MASYSDARLRQVNDQPARPGGDYVLYWMQAYRRLDHNHALDHAVARAAELQKPLVVYEGLKLEYPWASARLHQFILEGMTANAARAAKLGINYWPFVETPDNPGTGLLRRVAAKACLVVADDFPAFIHPLQIARIGETAGVTVVAVDGNSIVPLSLLGEPASAAVHLRSRIHKAFAEAWAHRAAAKPKFPTVVKQAVSARFQTWQCDDLAGLVSGLPIDQGVRPVTGVCGGSPAAKSALKVFCQRRLAGYAEHRSAPCPPSEGHASELSAYLHFGHISVEEVVAAVLGEDWTPDQLDLTCRGKRQGFYHADPDVNSFLDEVITWRDLGYHWQRHRAADTISLEAALPAWALATLRKHEGDPRPHGYSLEEFESASTHDDLWNAAQRELVETGRIQNYLRMLWAKKVLEWSRTPDDAYRTLEHLNNKYALDGRDPNSYSGILWCFGLFDRPWGPERPVFGKIRYMSSDSAAKKFDVSRYLEYVAGL